MRINTNFSRLSLIKSYSHFTFRNKTLIREWSGAMVKQGVSHMSLFFVSFMVLLVCHIGKFASLVHLFQAYFLNKYHTLIDLILIFAGKKFDVNEIKEINSTITPKKYCKVNQWNDFCCCDPPGICFQIERQCEESCMASKHKPCV